MLEEVPGQVLLLLGEWERLPPRGGSWAGHRKTGRAFTGRYSRGRRKNSRSKDPEVGKSRGWGMQGRLWRILNVRIRNPVFPDWCWTVPTGFRTGQWCTQSTWVRKPPSFPPGDRLICTLKGSQSLWPPWSPERGSSGQLFSVHKEKPQGFEETMQEWGDTGSWSWDLLP